MNGYEIKNPEVEKLYGIEFTGNIIPPNWYKTILKDTGKPDGIAISILSEIVYWHRPVILRDETSGQMIGLRQRFQADLLQRSYQSFADQFGYSKRQIISGVSTLEELGVVKKILRTIYVNGNQIPNVLYLKLNADRLYELTYPEQTKRGVLQKNVGPPTKKCGISLQKNVIPPTKNCRTNTEITTETTTKDYPSSSYQVTKEIFKQQIGYDAIKNDLPNQVDRLDEIVAIAIDVLTTRKKDIRVNGEARAAGIVKSQFFKLNMGHIKYVLDSLSNNTTEIRNIRAMIITSLYNAVQTMGNYYTAKVQHDLYGQNTKD